MTKEKKTFKPYSERIGIGAPKKYTPEKLYNKCNDYFNHVKNNPIIKTKRETYKGEVKEYIEEIERPYTIEGLCIFLEISVKTFNYWNDDEELCNIVTYAREIIRNDKLSGATAGVYNANIVIRDLSLRDTDTPQVINNIIPLNSNEVKAIANSLAAEYGKLPTKKLKTIDITPGNESPGE